MKTIKLLIIIGLISVTFYLITGYDEYGVFRYGRATPHLSLLLFLLTIYQVFFGTNFNVSTDSQNLEKSAKKNIDKIINYESQKIVFKQSLSLSFYQLISFTGILEKRSETTQRFIIASSVFYPGAIISLTLAYLFGKFFPAFLLLVVLLTIFVKGNIALNFKKKGIYWQSDFFNLGIKIGSFKTIQKIKLLEEYTVAQQTIYIRIEDYDTKPPEQYPARAFYLILELNRKGVISIPLFVAKLNSKEDSSDKQYELIRNYYQQKIKNIANISGVSYEEQTLAENPPTNISDEGLIEN